MCRASSRHRHLPIRYGYMAHPCRFAWGPIQIEAFGGSSRWWNGWNCELEIQQQQQNETRKKTPKPIISICAHEKRRFHDSGWCPGPTETRQYYLPRASGFPNEHRARVKVKAHIIDIYLEVVMMLFCDVFIFSHFFFYKFGMLWHLVACLVLGRWCCGLPWSLTAANDLMDSQSSLLMTPKAVCLRSSPIIGWPWLRGNYRQRPRLEPYMGSTVRKTKTCR